MYCDGLALLHGARHVFLLQVEIERQFGRIILLALWVGAGMRAHDFGLGPAADLALAGAFLIERKNT